MEYGKALLSCGSAWAAAGRWGAEWSSPARCYRMLPLEDPTRNHSSPPVLQRVDSLDEAMAVMAAIMKDPMHADKLAKKKR